MATLSSASPYMILQRFVLRRPTLPLLSQPKQFLCTPLKTTPSPTLSPSSTRSIFTTPRVATNGVALLENEPIESETDTDTVSISTTEGLKKSNLLQRNLPSLAVKEKKELASYAHSLGKKLKSQQVGKSGITDTVIMALGETLEANELLKLKIHNSCPGEFDDVVKQLEESTGSVVVGQIGRTVILYRPSITKLKAEEKKKQAQLTYLKKRSMSKSFYQSKRPVSESEQEPRRFGRGRRGSSRF